MVTKTICSVEEALKDFAAGEMLIVVDDAARENEGDFVMAADKVQPQDVNFMTKHGRGLVCWIFVTVGRLLRRLGRGLVCWIFVMKRWTFR